MATTNERYKNYLGVTQKAADLNYAAAVLGWDQETYMPPKGFAFRGRQLATLATEAHNLLTSDAYGANLQELVLGKDLTDEQSVNVQLSLEDYEKGKMLPASFVDEVTQASSSSLNAWVTARKANDYRIYAPELERMIELKKQQAQFYGFSEHPYDALMDDYEKGATVAKLDGVFNLVKELLPPLLNEIEACSQVNDQFFYQHFPKDKQWTFSMDVMKTIGYDFDAGRQDFAAHPFTTSFSPADVRITTRVNEQDFASMFWSSIHEAGHALYEQGLPEAQYGLPLGAAASLGIHESQSRIWENCIGRGLPFWTHFYPQLKTIFPQQLSSVNVNEFYKGMNKVQPSLIRTEADELTYHFHVLIRYEIEKALIEGSVKPKDLPELWNEKYKQYLGITPPDALTGVLQDVHWSHGSFGYFPTYSLGSFYAAQFFEEVQNQIPGLTVEIAKGDFSGTLRWLRVNVHRYGRRYRSDELCQKITGCPLDVGCFMRYASAKYKGIYNS